MRADNKR